MSRLDSFIRRLKAQRACLDAAAARIGDRPGPLLELGLGNGRTYDHLRELLPGREIFVFERAIAAHPACVPDARHLILGDIRETLPRAEARIGAKAVLAHADIGSGDADSNRALAGFLREALPPLMAPGALIVSDQDLDPAGWRRLEPPSAVPANRYFMFENAGWNEVTSPPRA